MTGLKAKLLIFFLCIALPVLCQTSKPRNLVMFDYKPFHFGYSVGINTMGFTMIPTDTSQYLLDVIKNPGININLITNVRIGKNLDFRVLPGIQFGQRDVKIDDLINLASKSWKIESVYLDMPVLIKYRSDRVNNYAPYLIAGFNPRIDLTGGEIQNWRPVQRLIKAIDVYSELGVGIDFYLVKVKVSTELKFAVGMLNIYDPPGPEPEYKLYANGVSTILSRMMIFSVHVE